MDHFNIPRSTENYRWYSTHAVTPVILDTQIIHIYDDYYNY